MSDIIIYLSLGVIIYFLGSFFIFIRSINKVVNFFKEHPTQLPVKLPKYIQEVKDDLGEEVFNEMYKKVQESMNE